MIGSRFSGNFGSSALLGAVKSAALVEGHDHPGGGSNAPTFVTISRQAGAGGRSLAVRLAELLNQVDPAPPGQSPWTIWDHELTEKVALDYGFDESTVDKLEDGHHPWFADLLSGLVGQDPSKPDEFKVYKRTAAAIRGLARVGRAIIVGRGGVFITRDLPGGVHVRLVAPHEARVAHMAELLKVDRREATKQVDQLDRFRDAFLRRYWPAGSLAPENFTVTINMAGVGEDAAAEAVRPLVLARKAAPRFASK